MGVGVGAGAGAGVGVGAGAGVGVGEGSSSERGALAEEPWPWVWAQKPSIGSVVIVVGSGAAAAAAVQQVCASRDALLTTVIAIGDEQELLRHGVGRGGTEKTGIIDAAVHSVDFEAKILLTTPRHGRDTRRVCRTGLEPRTTLGGRVLPGRSCSAAHAFAPRLASDSRCPTGIRRSDSSSLTRCWSRNDAATPPGASKAACAVAATSASDAGRWRGSILDG